MLRLRLLITLALLAVLSTGCVQMNMNTTIAEDGSGSMEMTMSLSPVLTESLDDLKALNPDEGLEDLDKLLEADKGELQAKVKGHGVNIKALDKTTVDGRETMHVALDFQDLEGLAYAMHELSGDDSPGLAIVDNGDGTYVLRAFEYDFPAMPEEDQAEEAPEEAPQMDPAQMGKQMEIMGKMMSAMSELKFVMKVTVPGDVVSSNAPKVEGRTSIWTVDQTNMMSAGMDMEPDITFSAKGLKIKNLKK